MYCVCMYVCVDVDGGVVVEVAGVGGRGFWGKG